MSAFPRAIKNYRRVPAHVAGNGTNIYAGRIACCNLGSIAGPSSKNPAVDCQNRYPSPSIRPDREIWPDLFALDGAAFGHRHPIAVGAENFQFSLGSGKFGAIFKPEQNQKSRSLCVKSQSWRFAAPLSPFPLVWEAILNAVPAARLSARSRRRRPRTTFLSARPSVARLGSTATTSRRASARTTNAGPSGQGFDPALTRLGAFGGMYARFVAAGAPRPGGLVMSAEGDRGT